MDLEIRIPMRVQRILRTKSCAKMTVALSLKSPRLTALDQFKRVTAMA